MRTPIALLLAAALAAPAAALGDDDDRDHPDRREERRDDHADRPTAAAKPIPAASLGLSKTDVLVDPAPPRVKEEDSSPGEKPALPRAYPGAPPTIPHGITDFLPITRGDSSCVDCHAVATKKEGEPTPIPPSHYQDLRRAPGKVRPKIAGARQVCTACHLPGSDAAPVAGNRFGER